MSVPCLLSADGRWLEMGFEGGQFSNLGRAQQANRRQDKVIGCELGIGPDAVLHITDDLGVAFAATYLVADPVAVVDGVGGTRGVVVGAADHQVKEVLHLGGPGGG